MSKEKLRYHVNVTHDYSKFYLMRGNRPIQPAHLKRLRQSILEEYLLTIIVVSPGKNGLAIIDGQHRYEIIKELGLPLYYVVRNGYGLDEIQRYNANASNWGMKEYLASFCQRGFDEYKKFRDFKVKYGFGYYETYALLTGKHPGNNDIQQKFFTGSFEVNGIREATRMADQIMEIKPYFKHFRKRNFVWAMIKLLRSEPNYNHKEFIKKLELQSNSLQLCANVERYIDLIQDIYNYRRRDKIRFS